MRFRAAGEGEREGRMSQRLCNAHPPRPPTEDRSRFRLSLILGESGPVQWSASFSWAHRISPVLREGLLGAEPTVRFIYSEPPRPRDP